MPLKTPYYKVTMKTLCKPLPKIKNERRKDEYINLAVKAYNKVLEEDRYTIERLKSSNPDANWGKIFYQYLEMERRQKMVEPYLPLRYTNGTVAEVETFNYIHVIEEARDKAAQYHYELAAEMLIYPEKSAARDAFYELHKIDQYHNRYRDVEALKYDAKQKGMNHIFLEFKQAYDVYLPNDLLGRMQEYNYERYADEWSEIHRTISDSAKFDLMIRVTVEGVDISPEHVKETHFHKEKEVEDGAKDLINAEGNVVVDSLGNVIQVPKFVTLHCDITEWQQTKSARLMATFEIFDNRLERRIVHQPLEDHIHFKNVYAKASGHSNILGNDYHEQLKGRPLPFPTNLSMIYEASESLKKQVSKSIDSNDHALASL